MQLTDFDYDLPPEYIAQTPAEPRDSSRLMVLNRANQTIETHRRFRDILDLINPGDVLVINTTRVIPARLPAFKNDTGGASEVLLLRQLTPTRWQALVKGRNIKTGNVLGFPNTTITATVTEELDGAERVLEFSEPPADSLSKIGEMPLPPYIHERAADPERYQTVYSRQLGSAAAPTAGLHFTPELDSQLEEKGVQILEVTLHVGLGTFATVKTNSIANHHMHSEWFELSTTTAQKIMAAKAAGNRIIAVGTTTTRVLEATASLKNGVCILTPQSGETAIFIYPPYQFKCVDGLITNFHLPESTLLMLISALVSQPNTPHVFTNFLSSSVGKAYQKAVVEKYRFFSFGDAMLLI